LAALHRDVRAISPHLEADRYWADEMAALQSAVLAGEMSAAFFLAAER
jgi:histidine ammonia-lyase